MEKIENQIDAKDLVNGLLEEFECYRKESENRSFVPTEYFNSLLPRLKLVLDQVTEDRNMQSFDARLAGLSLNTIQSDDDDPNGWDRVTKYINFQRYLYGLRKAILSEFGIHEKLIVLEKQAPVISPGIEAFEYTGNNRLDIKPSSNKYDLIFD